MKSFDINISNSNKLKIISDFIKSNNRVPTLFEFNDLIYEFNKSIPNLDKHGLYSPNLLNDPEISVKDLNDQFDTIKYSMDFILNRIKDIYKLLSIRVNNFSSSTSSIDQYLSKLDSESSALLLSKGFSSDLIYSVTENFASESLVRLDESSVNIDEEGVSASHKDFSSLNNLIEDINFDVFSSIAYKSINSLDDIDNILLLDGNFWSTEVLTESDTKDVSLILSLTLSEVSEINKIYINYEYSIDDVLSIFCAAEDNNFQQVAFKTPISCSNTFFINNTNVKYVKIIIKKINPSYKIDSLTNAFLFKIDSIELFNNVEINESVVICGPYSIVDAFGDIVSFNNVNLSACSENYPKTWIEFFLSNDNSTWIPVKPVEESVGGSLVSFENTTTNQDLSTINDELDLTNIDFSNSLLLELPSTDIYINAKLPISYLDKINSNHIEIKRNTPTIETIFDVDSGWFFDSENGLYKTTIIVNDDIYNFSLGGTTLYINNIAYTGNVSLSSGEYIISTNESNWISIESDITSESELRVSDPLYPYNHKYIIEGYNYPSTFSGTKIYNGVSEYFGLILKFVPISVFDSSNDLDIYTIKTYGDFIYFFVKTNKSFSDYQNELFDIAINIPNGDNTYIYFKAIFRSLNKIDSSILKSFTLRVA